MIGAHPPGDSPWTTERTEMMRALWDEGLSCAKIAEKLGGGITRNAVIGKARRLGLAMRTSPVALGGQQRNRRERLAKAPHDGTRPAGLPPIPTMPGKPRNQVVRVSALTGRPVAYEKPAPIRPDVVEIPQGAVLVQHLRPYHCRYPLVEAGAPGRWCFCPERAIPGHSWCEAHFHVCYWPQAQARRRA